MGLEDGQHRRPSRLGLTEEQLPGGELLYRRMLRCERWPWHRRRAPGLAGLSDPKPLPSPEEFSLLTPQLSSMDGAVIHTRS